MQRKHELLHPFFQQTSLSTTSFQDRPKCIPGFLESFQFKDSYKEFISQKEFLKTALSRILCAKNGPNILLQFIRSPLDSANQKALMDAFNTLTIPSLMGMYVPKVLEAPLTSALCTYLKDKCSDNFKSYSASYKKIVNESDILGLKEELNLLPASITTSMYYSPVIAEIQNLIAENKAIPALDYFKTLIDLICDNEFSLLCANPLSARGMRTTEYKMIIGDKAYYLDFNQDSVGSNNETGQMFSSIVNCCEALLTQFFSPEKISKNSALIFDSPCYFGWLNPLLTQMIYLEKPGKSILYPPVDKPFLEYMTLECLHANSSIFSMTYPTSRYSPEFALFIFQQFRENSIRARSEHPEIEFRDIPHGFYLDQGFVLDEGVLIRSFFAESRMRQIEELEKNDEKLYGHEL